MQPAITIAAIAAAAAGGFAYASHSAGSQLFGATLIAGPDPNQIALTYDDGPNPAATPQLLEVLARHNVRATFFLIGNYVRQCPALAREIAAQGHLIGNHTMTHPRLAFASNSRIRREIIDTNVLLEDTLGQPIHYFRCPYGARRIYAMAIVRTLGLIPVQWNVMVGDWKPQPAETIYKNLREGIARNQRRHRATNIVLHDGGHTGLNQPRLPTVEATQLLLQQYPPSNFVTIDAFPESLPGSIHRIPKPVR